MTGEVAVVGDIHGEFHRLGEALSWLSRTGVFTVFVGDYINRGPDTKRTLDLLVNFKDQTPGRKVFLRGNHEDALLSWLDDGGSADSFIRHGGLSTIRSYTADRSAGAIGRFAEGMPNAHVAFLRETSMFYEEDGLFVSHSGFDPLNPWGREKSHLLYGRTPAAVLLNTAPTDRPQPTVVAGHFMQRWGTPAEAGGIHLIDTGCGSVEHGKLSVLLLPEGEYKQF